MSVNPDTLVHWVDRFEGGRILVLGDLMLDEFTWGRVRRISPEAPVPVVEVENTTYRPGGSANVSANIRALGGVPVTVGVMGNDAAADTLGALLKDLGIDDSHLVRTDRTTTLKTRILAHGQQIVRADREERSPLCRAVAERVVSEVAGVLEGAAAMIVSDYDKGSACRDVLGAVLPAADRAGVPVLLDPKVYDADYYGPITMMTPNLREAELMSGVSVRDRDSLELAGRTLLSRFGCRWVLVTRGEDGMTLFDRETADDIPASAREVFDVTGAGDTVIATLAVSYAAGASMEEAAWLSNYAAGVVVGKVGTATVSPDELRQAIRAR